MNGIKMSHCRFYYDEEERTVVCVIPKTKNILIDFIEQHFDYPDVDLTTWSCIRGKGIKMLEMPNSFTGKAVCAPEDKFDVDTGCLIAFARAKNKLYNSFFKRANMYVQTIDKRLGNVIDMFNDFGLKLEENKEALESHIKELTEPDEEDEVE